MTNLRLCGVWVKFEVSEVCSNLIVLLLNFYPQVSNLRLCGLWVKIFVSDICSTTRSTFDGRTHMRRYIFFAKLPTASFCRFIFVRRRSKSVPVRFLTFRSCAQAQYLVRVGSFSPRPQHNTNHGFVIFGSKSMFLTSVQI